VTEFAAPSCATNEYNDLHYDYRNPVTMSHESYEQHWSTAAKARAEQGILDEMVSSELFDHTWIASVRQLEEHLLFDDGHTVLDAGCGWGRLLLGVKYFHPAVSIDGYELTPEFVGKARDLLERHGLADGVEVVQADLLETDLPVDRYDSLYSSRVVHYIQDKDLLIRKFHSALKEGGRAMIIIPNRSCPYQWFAYKHAPLYPIRSVGRIMEAVGFKQIRYGGYRLLPSSRRFAHDSVAARIEIAMASTPIGRFGGLAYVVGEK
jgi:ubiquinone/menaquinone biosynthesis C-methylase UbiE